MRKVIMVASAIMMLNLGGCATVTRGTTTAMVINTTPTGARVSTSNGFICESTPCRFDMSRKAEFRVSITKEGYKEVLLIKLLALVVQASLGMSLLVA